MNRSVRLLRNTILYFLGEFSSRILSFLLLPLYTSYLSTTDYGKVDVLFTFTNILIPLFTLQITFAGFRFLIEAKEISTRKTIISNVFFVHFVGMILFVLSYSIFWTITNYEFGAYVLIYVLMNDIASTLQQLTRGLQKNKLFVITGTLTTGTQLLANVVFIVGLGFKSLSLILAPVVGYSVAILVILVSSDIHRYFSIRAISSIIVKEYLRYSVPLVPDALFWWVLTGFGTLYLNYAYGTSAVGIYAVARKFPSLLLVFYSVFNLAWQEISYLEYGNKDRDAYYSSVFNQLIRFLFPIIIIALPVMKLIYPFFLATNFRNAAMYMPILFVGSLLSMLSTFYASGFQSAKKTNGIMFSTLSGMIVNVLFGFLLGARFGIFGVSIALALSYFAMLLVMIKRSRIFFKIKVEKPVLFASVIILAGIFFIYYSNNRFLQIPAALVGCLYFVALNYRFGKTLIANVVKRT